jgi:hypothetical protein
VREDNGCMPPENFDRFAQSMQYMWVLSAIRRNTFVEKVELTMGFFFCC